MQFGANHLGHFVLVNRLAPLLKARAPSRLVVLSSGAHRLHDVDLNDPNFEHKSYDRWDAYGQSKSANALFALAFDRRHRGRGVRAFTVVPGIITDTNLHHHLTQEDFAPLRLRARCQPAAQAPGRRCGNHRMGAGSSRPGGERRSLFGRLRLLRSEPRPTAAEWRDTLGARPGPCGRGLGVVGATGRRELRR